SCNSTNQCPQDKPCCSQYGECGTGSYCANGCNIKNSYNLTSCVPMPRMGSFDTHFDDKDKLRLQTSYLGNSSDSDWLYSGWIDNNDDALLFEMPKNSGGSVISSSKYLWYGRIKATLKTSHLPGVVTSFILYSDVEDEIDFEFVGNNMTNAQSNFYSQGALDYTRAKSYGLSDTMENWHTYEIDWQEETIDWYIDGNKVRTLDKKSTYNETSKKYSFPQTPSRIQMSLWPGGNETNAPGTIEWAGGKIDWNADDIKKNGYYYAYLKNVSVKAYDLPSGVGQDKKGNRTDFDAYVFNDTDGWAENVMITNQGTLLGEEDATGFD
ncbi:glycoside hydrolase family 16 protein, partial [Suhomyces tanzawaensis NRRL Y-17324]